MTASERITCLAIEEEIASARTIVRRSNKKSPPQERSSGDRTRNRLRENDRPAIEQEIASARTIVRRSNKKSPPRERSSGDRTRNRLRAAPADAILRLESRNVQKL